MQTFTLKPTHTQMSTHTQKMHKEIQLHYSVHDL